MYCSSFASFGDSHRWPCRNARAKAVEKTGAKKDWEQDFRATFISLANDAAQLRVRMPGRQLGHAD